MQGRAHDIFTIGHSTTICPDNHVLRVSRFVNPSVAGPFAIVLRTRRFILFSNPLIVLGLSMGPLYRCEPHDGVVSRSVTSVKTSPPTHVTKRQYRHAVQTLHVGSVARCVG